MSPRVQRALWMALWLAFAIPAIYQVVLLVTAVGGRFGYPYDLEWMEGGLLQHAQRISDNQGIYVPPSVDFIPYLYTPLYPGLVAFLGGATRETVPLFAALWAWSPLPLVGLATVGWWRKSAPSTEAHLAQPLRAALTLRREIGFDAALYLRPLGAALAGLALPTAQMVATVLVAAAQLLVAVDTIRLLAWAAPVLVLGAVKTIPPTWWALAILVTLVQRDERV